MHTITITTEQNETYTLVSNLFIDTYLADAQGDYVKIYLYLLRQMQAGQAVTTQQIADYFDITEKDLCRAFKYWIREEVLRLVYEGKKLVGITLLPLKNKGDQTAKAADPFANMADFQSEQDAKRKRKRAGADTTATTVPADIPETAKAGQTAAAEIPAKRELTPQMLSQIESNAGFSELHYLLETYLGRPITPAECRTLAYIYDDLHFSTELLEYLIEHCIMIGKKSLRYMEKVAIDWYRQGIRTVDAAKDSTRDYNALYTSVLKALGIYRRMATTEEIELINTWHQQYGFDASIIVEACKHAIRQKPQDANFNYVNGILENWHNENVHTLADINRLDQEFYNSRKKPVRASASVQGAAEDSKKNNSQSDAALDELTALFMEDINHAIS